ncbi:MAG: lipoyl(octanoyl) transferase LipB [Planctomycetota bacterium]
MQTTGQNPAPTRPDAAPSTPSQLVLQDWGTLAYPEASERQHALNQRVAAGESGPVLITVEHPPVITLSRRKGIRDHLVASEQHLKTLGIAVHDTDRGGDITYHGPGQLVAYPILRLGDFGLNLGRYMRLLEAVVLDTVAAFGIQGHTEPGATGVWVSNTENPNAPPAKLCAMGVRIRKNTTLHGLALNLTTDLSHFDTIVPCGLAGRPVTSLQQLLGPDCPDRITVQQRLYQAFQHHLTNPPTSCCPNTPCVP